MTVVTDVRAPAGPRLLAAGTRPSYADHVARHGELPEVSAAQLVRALYESGLSGRGGARFPVWRKIETAVAAHRSVVVGNAAEGEPASAKDRTLLEVNPQLVLDGLELVAATTDAERVVLAAREGAALIAAERAVADRTVARRGRLTIEVAATPARFLAGEESALAHLVAGGPALPRTPPVWANGVRGRPTLVHNVETLAHIALVARYGAAWFAGAGDPEAPGSMLFSVSTAGRSGGIRVVEAPTGTSYAQVLAAAGVDAQPQALLVGGYHGAWLPASALGLPATRVLLDRYGASAGAGVAVVLESGVCPLDVAARIVTYLAEQNAGQCGPCVNGLPALAGQLARLVRGEPAAADELARYAGLVDGRGGCHHPDGTAGLVRSTLLTFSADVAAHAAGACAARGGVR